MALTDRMKEARKNKGLTQEAIAKKIGVAKSTYTGYEKGNSEPNMLILSRIMNVLEVDANFLFQDEMNELRNATATPQEMEKIIKKYRTLDLYGKEAVDGVLDVEYRRCEENQQSKAESVRAERERTSREAAEEVPTLSLDEKVAELERQNQEKDRQLQELAAKVAAIEEEDDSLGLTDAYSASPMVSVGNIRPGEKVKK